MNQTEGLKTEQRSLLPKRLKRQSADIHHPTNQSTSVEKGSRNKPSYRQYKLSEAYRTFVMGFNSKPFSLSQTQLVNRRSATSQQGKNPADLLECKKEALRKVHLHRQLSPHHRQMRLEYNGLTSKLAPKFSCRLLKELNQATEPKKARKRRLFLSNFCIPKSSANLLSGSSPASEFNRMEIDGLRLDSPN